MALTISQWNNADRRVRPRVVLHLRLAVVYPQRDGGPARPIYHGSSDDVCMSGLSMVAEDNVFHEGKVTVLLALPPVHSWAAQKIITATARMTYVIHSSKLNGFKIGMTFLEFRPDGKELLQVALRRGLKSDGDAGTQDSRARSRTAWPGDSQPRGW